MGGRNLSRSHSGALDRTYHLTAEQIESFDRNGYLIVRKAIEDPLLGRIQKATERIIARGRELGPERAGPDYQYSSGAAGSKLFRVDYLHAKGEPSTLQLLGCPTVLGIAESLAGPNLVPTYEALVFKDEGDGKEIRWHQDAVHPRNYRIFNVDIYLDSSCKGAGALRVVPGSQRSGVDFCQLEQKFGWEPPGVVEVEMEPGDVLVHDVMVVHGSEATQNSRLRRTLYYEFRSAEQIESEGPWDRGFIDKRLRLVSRGLAEYLQSYPRLSPFSWRPSIRFRPTALTGETELRVPHEAHTPGAYCSAGDVSLD